MDILGYIFLGALAIGCFALAFFLDRRFKEGLKERKREHLEKRRNRWKD